MNVFFLIAGVLALLTGVAHSLLGEMLIFRHLRSGTIVPALAAHPLRERHIRIIWSTWHLGSVFGWAFAGILFRLASPQITTAIAPFVVNAIVFTNIGGSILVLAGTKGRHPGWLALLLVAVFTWLASGVA